ncbi:MAG TPA: M1 family metallopeptidase, partial [Gemmatimonadales bacterium]|nr:M1 family metallopeptidase [Gemmatimonadales bacterium]
MLLLLVASMAIQSPQQVADSSPFRALALPAANRMRSANGAPGPNYWQQEADYTIRASVDTASSVLTGSERIHYVNHSPDSLPFVWMQIEQNIFAKNSITYQLNQPPLEFAGGVSFDFTGQGFIGGITISKLESGGKALIRTEYGTMMRVELPSPLAPGAAIDFDVDWRFPIPPYGGGRMGRVGNRLYELGQWYPRMVVYDDIHGWNPLPYIGAGEFYLEYGNFDVTLTLPAGYVLGSTGTVANPEEVWSADTRARIEKARSSESAVGIITKEEATANGRRSTTGTKNWHVTATNVRDFAWCASPDYRWDASGYDGKLINTLYRPEAQPWLEANRMARFTIKHFSEQWFTYPWPKATTCEGPVQGMEYPMITFVPALPGREDQFWDLMHEFGHQWFPMVTGTDERRYPWMDEGFNSFIDYGAAAEYFKGTAYGDTVWREVLSFAKPAMAPGAEKAMFDKPVEQQNLAWAAYQKPPLMLILLRDQVLGKATFERAFRDYIRRWQFKHPQPADFFRTMSDVSGQDLDWFWREWVFTTARLDQAVDSVSTASAGISVIHLENRGTMVMPAELAITFADGMKSTVKLPVEMWNLGARFDYRVP